MNGGVSLICNTTASEDRRKRIREFKLWWFWIRWGHQNRGGWPV